MKKSAKSKNKSAVVPKVDPYLEGLMAKLLERLVSLEHKVDTVVAQTSGKPEAVGHAPKPFQNAAPLPLPRRDRMMYEAICADCHKVCEVPFKPAEGRAIYCKECFARRRSGGSVPPPQKPADKPVAPALAEKKSKPAKKSKKKK